MLGEPAGVATRVTGIGKRYAVCTLFRGQMVRASARLTNNTSHSAKRAKTMLVDIQHVPRWIPALLETRVVGFYQSGSL